MLLTYLTKWLTLKNKEVTFFMKDHIPLLHFFTVRVKTQLPLFFQKINPDQRTLQTIILPFTKHILEEKKGRFLEITSLREMTWRESRG